MPAGSATDTAFLADQLQRMYAGEAWHGPSVTDALTGVTAAQASAHSSGNAHSIHELAHHIHAWMAECRRRLGGSVPMMPSEGNFPPPGATVDEPAWKALRARLDSEHTALMADVRAFNPARWHEKTPGAFDDPTPVATTFLGLMHGLVQHHAYHAGQIMLLRRAMGA